MRITDTLSPAITPGFDAWISELNELDFALSEVYDLDSMDKSVLDSVDGLFEAGYSPIETKETLKEAKERFQ